MLANLIEGGDDAAWIAVKADEKARILSAIADEAQACRDYVCENARTGGEHEYELFQLIYELRCYYGGDVPEPLKPAWEQFQIGTTPYRESIPITLNSLRDMQFWAQSEQTSTAVVLVAAENISRSDTTSDSKKDFPPKMPETPDVRDLVQKLQVGLAKGKTQSQIAREFTGETEGDDAKAQSLLRQARRYRHLWGGSDS